MRIAISILILSSMLIGCEQGELNQASSFAADARLDTLSAAVVASDLDAGIEPASVLQHALLNSILGGDLRAENVMALRVQRPSLGYYVAARLHSGSEPLQVTGVWFIPTSSAEADEIWPVNGPATQLSTGDGHLAHARGKRNEQAIQALTGYMQRHSG